ALRSILIREQRERRYLSRTMTRRTVLKKNRSNVLIKGRCRGTGRGGENEYGEDQGHRLLHGFLSGFTKLMPQPTTSVFGRATGLPASTASMAFLKSDSVAAGRRLSKSATRLSIRPRYRSCPSLHSTA